MADTAKLKKNLEKVSYSIAGVLSVILLAIPFTMTGEVKDLTAKVEQLTSNLADRKSDSVPKVEGVSFSDSDLRSIWAVKVDTVAPAWVAQSRPAIVRVFSDAPASQIVHEPPCITSVELVRDAESKKPVLRVSGKLGNVENATVDRVLLERKVGEGEWAEVQGFAEAGDFTYDDKDVQAGKKYAYRSTSVVEAKVVDGKTSTFASPADAQKVSANELATLDPIPVDLAIQISGFSDPVVDGVSAVKGVLYYFDYAAGKSTRLRPPGASKGWEAGFAFGEDVDGKKRYKIDRVVPETKTIRIVDYVARKKTLYKQDARKGLDKTETWEAVTDDCGAGAAAGDEDGGAVTDTDADAATEKVEPEKTTPKASSGTGASSKKSGSSRRRRRGFGE